MAASSELRVEDRTYEIFRLDALQASHDVARLAAMRDAIAALGGDPSKINPLIPAELVIDHSVQVDAFASRLAFDRNVGLEFERNHERYLFLRWGQKVFSGFK